ncbi:hemolysin family protein [Mumia sp. zg.B17]|uniref:hemolysin family protein n=1 Tax=unclassified Mumia TaxID=2621872 RepID=UPI001C6EEDD9|nr:MULTISPECIES: hemolysin family protein [unclassified Mumia]MBW9206957.1 hemolysin family protein [Mumia sp. zg.B17]MBW9210710.1 hemolysin family protein [Mumia sp. zg.B21]MDD9349201.1 hemolysin family protein [Mumia sp.]
MNPLLAILLVIVLLALNALFVAAEFALISARRTQLEPKARAGSRPARLAIRAMQRVSLAMAAAQLGITLCSLGLGAVGEPAIAHLFEPLFEALAVPHALVHPISFVIAMAIVTYLHVVLGEMVPKNIALAGPDRAVLWLGPFMLGMIWLLKPFVVALNAIANGAVRLARLEPKDEVGSTFTSDEVAGLIDESHREGLLDSEEYELVSGALGFEAGTVERVLLPRGELVAVPVGATRADVEEACARTGYSRFPVTDSHDALVGYLHIKDALEVSEATRPIPAKWIRPLGSVRRGSRLYDALRLMQQRGAHMARVVGDDGAELGVVMLEDVLEELVGEVRAEVRDPSRRAGGGT